MGKTFIEKFIYELDCFDEYMDFNDYWDELDSSQVLERLREQTKQSYVADGYETEESIRERIAEVSMWHAMFPHIYNSDEIVLLEVGYGDDEFGLCEYAAFSYRGIGYTVDFVEHTTGRATDYDTPKAV